MGFFCLAQGTLPATQIALDVLLLQGFFQLKRVLSLQSKGIPLVVVRDDFEEGTLDAASTILDTRKRLVVPGIMMSILSVALARVIEHSVNAGGPQFLGPLVTYTVVTLRVCLLVLLILF